MTRTTGKKAGGEGETREKVLELARSRESLTVKEVSVALGIADGSSRYHLANLEHEGLIERVPGDGVLEYRSYPPHEDAPEAPPGAAPATTEIDPEPPAASPAAPGPSTQEPPAAGPPPFAGVDSTVELSEPGPITVDWFRHQVGVMRWTELGVLDSLEQMDDEARQRVLTYAVARWFCP